jgi:hypothetical protein
MAIAALEEQAEATVDEAAIPVHLDPQLAPRRRDATYRFRLLTPAQQATYMLREMPAGLRGAPAIDWASVPTKAAIYLFFGRGLQDPCRWQLLLGAGVLGTDGLEPATIVVAVACAKGVPVALQAQFGEQAARTVAASQWAAFGADRAHMEAHYAEVSHYSSLCNHLRDYRARLTPDQRKDLADYFLPEMPSRFVDRYVPTRAVHLARQQRRKAKTDVLTPIVHVLVALIERRKAAALRLLTRYREVRAQIEAGTCAAPVTFEYDDVVADVNRDAARVEDVHWIERPVHLRFTVWTPAAWMVAHGRAVYLRYHIGRTRAYHDGLEDRYLLECHPPYSDALWFGDGLARGGFIRVGRSINGPRSSQWRRDPSAPTWGDIHFAGLLMPYAGLSNWAAFRYPEAIFIEPETLYRGVLYGSAYSILGLTSGARFYELAQISLDRFEEPRPYKVLRDGQPTGKLDLIYLQRLLPKGCSQESERQLFNVSGGIDLLLEIAEHLQAHYGEVPVVPPEREKAHCLRPERYLFQWGGRAVTLHAANVLIKFMVGDLEFRDTEGHPFKISSHLYRHAGQTAARHDYGVPASVIAEVALHHRSASDRVPEATEYYTLMPQQQRLELHQQFLVRLRERALERPDTGIDPLVEQRELIARCDETTRAVLDRWHTYHPVVFGHCGRAGLCVRGVNRVNCLGCPYLNPRPEHRAKVQTWHRAYLDLAKQLEASGNASEAREHRYLASECSRLMGVMDLLERAEADGAWQPAYRALTAPGKE